MGFWKWGKWLDCTAARLQSSLPQNLGMRLVYLMTWCDVIQPMFPSNQYVVCALWEGSWCSLLCVIVLLLALNQTSQIFHIRKCYGTLCLWSISIEACETTCRSNIWFGYSLRIIICESWHVWTSQYFYIHSVGTFVGLLCSYSKHIPFSYQELLQRSQLSDEETQRNVDTPPETAGQQTHEVGLL